MKNRAYARNHYGRVPFAPIADLGEARAEVAVRAVTLLGAGFVEEATELAGLWDDLLTAAIFRGRAEREAKLR